MMLEIEHRADSAARVVDIHEARVGKMSYVM